MPDTPDSQQREAARRLLDLTVNRTVTHGGEIVMLGDEIVTDATDEVADEIVGLGDRLSTAAEAVDPPMTHGQHRLWDALAGRCLSAKDLCADNELDTSEDTVRQWVHRLRGSGRDIRHRQGCGYYRPDSPPPDEPT